MLTILIVHFFFFLFLEYDIIVDDVGDYVMAEHSVL